MEFYKTYNGAPYNSLEPTSICHAAWVSRVEWSHDDLPPPGHTELPLCPVCLGEFDLMITNCIIYIFWQIHNNKSDNNKNKNSVSSI